MKSSKGKNTAIVSGNSKVYEQSGRHLVRVVLFIFCLVYFSRFGNYILSFQENQTLFLFGDQYLQGFLNKPGGLLVYAGKFVTSFYLHPAFGAVLLAILIALISYLFDLLFKLLDFDSPYAMMFSLLPSCFLLVMQSHYYHFMEINLGILLVAAFLVLAVFLDQKDLGFVPIVLFPLFYYVAGAFSWLFLLAFVVYQLAQHRGKRSLIASAIMIVLTALVLFISEKWIFIQPRSTLIGYPFNLINDSIYRLAFYALVGVFPLLFLMTKVHFVKTKVSLVIAVTASFFALVSSGVVLYRVYNPQTARVLQLEKYLFEEKWDDVVRFSERNPSENLIGQYFYNVALSETNQLCDKLFSGQKNIGVNSLILPWGNEHLSYGAYFYYSAGLINEAQRWAYEDMVVNGFKSSNLKMLVKTNLINGNYPMALKYLSILKKSRNYKKWAQEYEKLAVSPDLINGNADLNYKRSIMPKGDFFIQVNSPQNNIPLLLNSNPGNKRAFEYKMAWLMLSKDIEGIAVQLKDLKTIGYTRIPKHLEEAVMIYYNAKGMFPDLGGLSVSQQTLARFNQYVDAFKANRQNMEMAKKTLGMLFGDTFMFYYHFS